MATDLTVKIIRKIAEIPREEWDLLVAGSSPFLEWDWLDTLEQTGCVQEKTGWLPHHLVVERGGKLVAAAPMYLKLHSMGEFVFDYEWADAAQRLGLRYYPKMLVGVPITPVTGNRLLTVAGEDRPELIRVLGQALGSVAADNKISSVHVNFCSPDEVQALEQ